MEIPVPRPAATVLVVRDGAVPLQVFMVKRAERSAFMAGAMVFPGGRVEESDRAPLTLEVCDGLEWMARALPDLPPDVAAGYGVAAIRELFEEAGVLLARDAEGRFPDFSDPEVATRFSAWRASVHQGMLPLPLVLQQEGLRFALDALTPYAWWVTPELESRRFDTRFFIARVPEGQKPVHDESETVASEWLTAEQALAAYARAEINLAPPTLRSLEELSRCDTVEAALQFASRRRICRIQPRIEADGEDVVIILPGDPSYPVPEGQEVEGETRIRQQVSRWWQKGAPAP